MSQYIFFILLDIPPEHEVDFNMVYDTDHLPHMLKVTGVNDCIRYKLEWSDNSDMIRYLAIYHINSPELPRSDAWKKQATFGRWPTDVRGLVTARRNGVYRQIFHTEASGYSSAPHKDATGSEYIYFLQQSVPAEIDAKFNELYGSNHIPLMMQAPGVNACTRYKLEYSDTGDTPDYLAIYAVNKSDTPRSAEWKKQTGLGRWPTEIRPHFTARRNGVYHRISIIKPK
jgi:hypothetical protein